MNDFAIHYDPDQWLRVPVEFPDEDDDSAQSWAARQAVLQRERGFTETLETGTLDQYFLDVISAARAAGEHDSFWALIADDAPAFIAVTLDVSAADGSLDELLGVLVAHRQGEYEPASHAVTEAAGLGEGVNVLRTDVDEHGQVRQSLYYVFRAADSDYVISTAMFDTAALAWAVPKILEFIDGIQPAVSS